MSEKGTKQCKYCKSQIPADAKVCPHCRKKQSKKGCIWGLVIVLVLFVIFSFAMCGGGGDDSKSASGGNGKQKEPQGEFHVGDIVETEDLKISFLSAEEYESDNEFVQPDEGNIYYQFSFEFENISSEDIAFSSVMDWEIYADDYKIDQEYLADDIGGLNGTVSAGKKTQGSIVVQVPESTKRIEVHYKHNLFNDNQVIFVVEW